MQQEEYQALLVEGTIVQPPVKKTKDPVIQFVYAQAIVCLLALLCALAVRFVGGTVYQTIRDRYCALYCDQTTLSQVTQPQDETSTPQTTTDMIVHTMATVTATETNIPQGGGDSLDDSMTIQSEKSVLMNASYRPTDSANAMAVPVKGTVTSPFGYRIHPIYGTRLFHNGVDIGADAGTPIGGALSGTVKVAEYDSSYGNYVILDHGNDFCTLYAHCSSLLVSVGDQVEKGETIALVGSTGVSTGPHLHFEVRRGEYRINPQWLVDLS